MPQAPILCLGARWQAEDVYWRTSSAQARLMGVPRSNLRGRPTNFAHQSGVYVLYSGPQPVYVGQANQTLFSRLKTHWLKDDLAGRWETFTWFGLRRGLQGGRLSVPDVDFHISTKQLLDHFEAAMIHAFEPPMNGQDGRFGAVVIRYRQVRDPRLGPDDRSLLESIADKGNFLPAGDRPSATGWRAQRRGSVP